METSQQSEALNPLGTPRSVGLAVLRLYSNLKVATAGPAHANLDVTWRAGRASDLTLRIRRQKRLSFSAVKSFGEFTALSERDLMEWALPALAAVGIVEYTVDGDGVPLWVEERVGVAAPVLEQIAGIWGHLGPAAEDRCAIASADHAAYCPMTESEHRAALEHQGHSAHLHESVFQNLIAIGLLRREYSTPLRENVLWAPYVWGSNALDIAAFMKRLPANEREALTLLSRNASEHPGVTLDELGTDKKMMEAARHAGLIDATRVRSGSQDRAFGFPPTLETEVGAGLTDATHERKLFVAHILNGHRYGHPGTGRINHPLALVRALINKGAVGPTTAARRDYGLLEAAGIVRAEEAGGGQAMLYLVKDDVARESFDLLELALEDDPSKTADSVEKLRIPGTALMTPEQDRRTLQEPVGDEREVVQSAVERLRTEIGQSARGENIHG